MPAFAVGSVGWAFVTTLRPARVLAARVHGGPCPTGAPRSLLVALSAARGDEREPAPATSLHVRLTESNGVSSSWHGTTDSDGLVELSLGSCAEAAPLLEIESGHGTRLARGTLAPDAERWRNAVRQGGWLTGQASGELRLRVAPLEGTLAVPFASTLLLSVEAPDGSPARGLKLSLEADGATLGDGARPTTDARGQARVALEPLEHAISLRVEARSEAGSDGRWYGALPVVPGALHVALDGQRLRVRSPIARERAYLTLVDERARLAGAIVDLDADAGGGAEGFVDLTTLPVHAHTPLWAVVSSEADKRSAALVGWPLRDDGWPPRTFDALDQPLLDGLSEARASERAARQERRRRAALAAGLAGLLGGGLFVLEVRGAQRRSASIVGVTPRRSGAAIGLALTCILLGLVALVWFGTLGAP